MELTKNTINGIGGLAVVATLIGGGLFIAKPQYLAAGELDAKTSAIHEGKIAQEAKLATLISAEKDFATYRNDLAVLTAQIPREEGIDNIVRVVVNSLPSGVKLQSFAHFPMVPHVAPKSPLVSLSEPPVTGRSQDPAAGDKAKKKAAPVAGLQQLPLEIVVKAKSNNAVAQYMKTLSTGSRLILVESVQTTSETDKGVVATINAYAFVNN